MDISKYNREAWDRQVDKGDQWTIPVDGRAVQAARQGDWQVVLTPTKPVPRNWFPASLSGKSVLCLASAGGQQGPILAAAGGHVTVFDNSPKQLGRDEAVAKREGLSIALELGDMRDLSRFADETFDLVFHPCSNCFVDSVLSVWREAYRVLKPGCALLSGFANPVSYIFDLKALNEGKLHVRHSIPYSDAADLSQEELESLLLREGHPLCAAHTLHDQIQGQIDAGFAILGFYEDGSGGGPLDAYIDTYIATRSVKLLPTSAALG